MIHKLVLCKQISPLTRGTWYREIASQLIDLRHFSPKWPKLMPVAKNEIFDKIYLTFIIAHRLREHYWLFLPFASLWLCELILRADWPAQLIEVASNVLKKF